MPTASFSRSDPVKNNPMVNVISSDSIPPISNFSLNGKESRLSGRNIFFRRKLFFVLRRDYGENPTGHAREHASPVSIVRGSGKFHPMVKKIKKIMRIVTSTA
jgi:hypothetical protein